jgi:hypothetical protein
MAFEFLIMMGVVPWVSCRCLPIQKDLGSTSSYAIHRVSRPIPQWAGYPINSSSEVGLRGGFPVCRLLLRQGMETRAAIWCCELNLSCRRTDRRTPALATLRLLLGRPAELAKSADVERQTLAWWWRLPNGDRKGLRDFLADHPCFLSKVWQPRRGVGLCWMPMYQMTCSADGT